MSTMRVCCSVSTKSVSLRVAAGTIVLGIANWPRLCTSDEVITRKRSAEDFGVRGIMGSPTDQYPKGKFIGPPLTCLGLRGAELTEHHLKIRLREGTIRSKTPRRALVRIVARKRAERLSAFWRGGKGGALWHDATRKSGAGENAK